MLTNTTYSVHNANVTQLVVVQQLLHYVQVADITQPIIANGGVKTGKEEHQWFAQYVNTVTPK